jgi:hypothetical protein
MVTRYLCQRYALLCNIIAILLIIAAAYPLFSFIPLTNPTNPITHFVYHPDEGVWIAAGKHTFQKSFVERDWHPETWQNQPYGSFGASNPPVGKYLIGASLFMAGVVDSTTTIPGYNPEDEFVWAEAAKRQPPQELLDVVHRMMKWLGIASAIAFWGLAKNLTNSMQISLSATLFFVLSPLVIRNSQRAMMEIPLLLFTLLALFLASRLFLSMHKKRFSQKVFAAVGVGILCGLALATKLNALLMLASVLFWGASFFYFDALAKKEGRRNQSASAMKATAVMLTILVAAGVVFWAVNPLLHHNPIQNADKIFSLGRQVALYQVPATQRLDTWGDRIQTFFSNGLSISGIFGYWLNMPLFDYLLAIFGGTTCVCASFNRGSAAMASVRHIWILSWVLITGMGIIMWTPFNWIRWYVPMEPCWALIEGIGFTVFMKQVVRAISPQLFTFKVR